ncbi:hypothetical protein ACLMJK_006228 [Lecanora helva]
MWTLECDGDILAHKRIWLRPGKTYLFGRTLPEKGKTGAFQIKDEKSVSRQHLTLTVSNVKPGDTSLVHTRSEIGLKDEGTKFGTEIDGSRIKGNTKILKNEEHTFKLGKSSHIFRIKWHPVVFTFSLSSKDTKGGKDPLSTYRSRLEDLDIKVLIPYVIDATTHVVSSKRNTAKGLQALINAKYIVTDSYIDALVYATTPDNLDELESLSPLEEDFDANWPKPQDHLPAKSKEPSDRPAEDFAPNPQRNNVLEGYTFVFCDPVQFEALQAPVNNGGGKALEFPLNQGKTTAEEIVRYVKGVAGEKGLGEFEDGGEGKGVVLVAFRGDKGLENWVANLITQVALALDQRLIEQSEFLDAILGNDASILRRSLPLEEQESGAQTSNDQVIASATAPAAEVVEDETSVEPAAPQPRARRARARGAVVSRFKGFGDDDDDSVNKSTVSSTQPASTHPQVNSELNGDTSHMYQNGTHLTDSGMALDAADQANSECLPENPRKRSAPSPDEEDDEEQVDRLLPAAAAMKRRRLEEGEDSQRNGILSERSFESSRSKAKEKSQKPKKEINIKDVVRERREAEEEAAKRDEENLRDTLDGMSIEEMKRLAVVEEMDIPNPRNRSKRGEPNGDTNGRWDERWNGRKNFKKFRRRGEGTIARRGTSVIVPLEEVKKKDFGIGEDYWLESERTKRQRKEKERTTQSQSQSQPFITAKSQPAEVPSELAIDGDLPEAIDLEAPRTTRHQERTQHTDETSSYGISQNANKKRPAASQGTDVAPRKRKKFAVQDSDSDSEDELKFRFKG